MDIESCWTIPSIHLGFSVSSNTPTFVPKFHRVLKSSFVNLKSISKFSIGNFWGSILSFNRVFQLLLYFFWKGFAYQFFTSGHHKSHERVRRGDFCVVSEALLLFWWVSFLLLCLSVWERWEISQILLLSARCNGYPPSGHLLRFHSAPPHTHSTLSASIESGLRSE